MLKRLCLIGLLGGLFLYGVIHLFVLRFQVGDVYPAYSSLRTDPLGIKAFYDVCRELPGMRVQRNYRPIFKLQPSGATTLFYVGVPAQASWRQKELKAVEAMATAGSRIVITFLPVSEGPGRRELASVAAKEKERVEKREKNEERKAGEKVESGGEAPEKKEETDIASFNAVAARWGFSFRYFPRGSEPPKTAFLEAESVALEEEISWHTALYFEPDKSSDWKTIYTCGDQPVLMERAYGKGSILLAADSYFLSNEALRNEAPPSLLSWMIGASTNIMIDEESHGVREEPGISALVGRYGLHGAIGVLTLLAVLFLWKNTQPLVPMFEGAEESVVSGKEASEGFVNLLRRGIPPGELMRVCAMEWKKAFDRNGTGGQGQWIEEAVAAKPAKMGRSRDPVALYAELTARLSKTPSGEKRRNLLLEPGL